MLHTGMFGVYSVLHQIYIYTFIVTTVAPVQFPRRLERLFLDVSKYR